MRNKLYIRADGDANIGAGHLVRCFALASMLKEDFEILFVCKSISSGFIRTIEESTFTLRTINVEEDFLSEIKPSDVVVLDHYGLDSDYQMTVKDKGCKLICIDDIHDKEFYADLIINHSPGVKASDYKAQDYTDFALGPAYALLRPEFLKNRRGNIFKRHLNIVFVCFGGADPFNLTMQTLEILMELNSFKKIIVVVGDLYNQGAKLKDIASKLSTVEVWQGLEAKEMRDFMERSDLAVLPSSGVLFEAISVGLPSITGYYVANQEQAAKGLHASNLVFYCGNFLEDYRQNLTKIINSLSIDDLNNLIVKQQEVIGNSTENYRNLFCKFKYNEGKEARNYSFLNFTDLSSLKKEMVWKWRNSDGVRKWMYSTDIISYENHLKFIELLKRSKNKVYYLVKRDSIPTGVFNMIRLENGEWELGYYIAPEYHGKSLGIEFYHHVLNFVFEKLKFNRILSYALIDNKAANSLNDLFGFTKERDDRPEEGDHSKYFLRRLTKDRWKESIRNNEKIDRLLKFTNNKKL